MTVLADTSIWVDYFKRGKGSNAASLDDLLTAGEVVMCGPVVADSSRAQDRLIAPASGFCSPASHGRTSGHCNGAASAKPQRGYESSGDSVALTDIEIAVAAADSSSRLWTRDADFERVRLVLSGLRFFEP